MVFLSFSWDNFFYLSFVFLIWEHSQSQIDYYDKKFLIQSGAISWWEFSRQPYNYSWTSKNILNYVLKALVNWCILIRFVSQEWKQSSQVSHMEHETHTNKFSPKLSHQSQFFSHIKGFWIKLLILS